MMSSEAARYCADLHKAANIGLRRGMAFDIILMAVICLFSAWCVATIVLAREAAVFILLLPLVVISGQAVACLRNARGKYGQIKKNRELIDMYEAWAAAGERDERAVR